MSEPAQQVAIVWYHTIEISDGVVTPGLFDTREAAKRIPFPASFEGQRLRRPSHGGVTARPALAKAPSA